MKKIIGLIVLMVLLTGCDATYNMEITGDTFKEDVDVFVDSSLKNKTVSGQTITYKELVTLQKDNYRPVLYNDSNYNPYIEGKQDDVSYYDLEIIDNDSKYGVNYKYDFNIKNYVYSSAVNTCYKEITINKSDTIYTIKTNKLVSCLENNLLDKLTINLKINNKVLDNNADSINGNVYTWVITKDNYTNKSIKIMYNKDNTNLEYSGEKNPENPTKPKEEIENKNEVTSKKSSILTYIFVGAAVLIFIVGIFGYIKYKSV